MKSYVLLALLAAGVPRFMLAQSRADSAVSTVRLPAEFVNALERAHMVFEMPTGYSLAEVKANEDMGYLFALRSADKQFEVRYTIWPLDSQLTKYAQRRNEGDTVIDPNTMYPRFTLMHMANISSQPFDQLPEIHLFEGGELNEFHADWAGGAGVELRKSFAGALSHGMILAMHKDKIGDAWCILLAQSDEALDSHLGDILFSLHFK